MLVEAARRKKVYKIITFTGHSKDNPLSKLGDINLWIDSKAYTHLLKILTSYGCYLFCDLIIGKESICLTKAISIMKK